MILKSNFLKVFQLFIFMIIHFSCTPNQVKETKVHYPNNIKTKVHSTAIENIILLKFTSGIRTILHDSKGNYWFGSHQEGLCLFDGVSYKYFTMDDGLYDNQVRSIQEHQNGSIWFGTAEGVNSYDNGVIKKHEISKDVFTFTQPPLKSNSTLAKDDLWFNAGNNSGVYRYDGHQVSYVGFKEKENDQYFNQYGNTGVSRSNNGVVWLATYAAVFGYSLNAIETIDDQSLGFQLDSEKLHVRSILADSKGNLWIGNNGIGVLLKKDKSIINFSKQKGLVHFLSTGGGERSPEGTLEHVFVIDEDHHGNIWFGDRDTGAWKYDGKTMTNYTVDPALSSPMIWDIYEDKDQNLLFAMADGGVYQFNGNSFDRKF